MPIILMKHGSEGGGLPAPTGDLSNKYESYLAQVKDSQTAQKILDYILKRPLYVGLSLIDHSFDSMYIPPEVLEDVNDLSPYSGGIAVVNIKSTMKIDGTEIPIGVSMMHELGHAKQYLSDSKTFYDNFLKARNGNNAAKLLIENDNLARHEMKICQELDLPFRAKYD